MQPSPKLSAGLTEDQQVRIAANLQAAKERLAAKRAALADPASSGQGQGSQAFTTTSGEQKPSTPKRKKPKYVDYDLTTLQDSRGGFLLPEEAEQAGGDEAGRRDRHTRSLPKPLPTLGKFSLSFPYLYTPFIHLCVWGCTYLYLFLDEPWALSRVHST